MEILRDRELAVRPATEADSYLLANWWNDGAVMAHAGFVDGVNTTIAEVAGKLAKDSDETGRRLILLREGEAIGEMNYRIIAPRTAEIGINICRSDRQEKGYGRRFLTLLIDHLFIVGNQLIQLDTMIENERAQHVYESIGFRKTAIRDNCWQDPAGRWRTAVAYELSEADWQSRKENRKM